MILDSIEKEGYGVVENTDEKPQRQEDDSIGEVERGVSEAKLDDGNK